MQAKTKKTLGIVAGVVVVVILILALWLKFTNVVQYKFAIEEQISTATGYPFVIEGDMGIKLLPLSVSIKELHLRNPAGFEALDFMYVPECRVGVKLMPLIMRNFVVKDITLNDLVLNLERNSNGQANWDFGPSGAGASGSQGNAGSANKALIGQMILDFPFSYLKVDNGSVTYIDKRGFSGGVFNLQEMELNAGPFLSARERLNFAFTAKMNKLPVKMSGYTTESLGQILDSNWPYEVQLHFIETSPGLR